MVVLSELESLPGKACCKGIFSKRVTDNEVTGKLRSLGNSATLRFPTVPI